MKLLAITLGIMTGGFVDFGQIVFTLQAGASFRYTLLWPIVLGTAEVVDQLEETEEEESAADEKLTSIAEGVYEETEQDRLIAWLNGLGRCVL